MKIECYRKRLINKIRYFFNTLFGRDSHAKSMIYHGNCSGTTLPPLAGLKLDIASKIMQVNDWRNNYGRY